MELPQEYVFNKNYKTSTLQEMYENIGQYIIELEKSTKNLDSDNGDLIDALSEEADKIEYELQHRGAIDNSVIVDDFKTILTEKVLTNKIDINTQNTIAGV